MPPRIQLFVVCIGLLSVCGSASDVENGPSQKDGAFDADDAVIVNAPLRREKRQVSENTREGKQFYFLRTIQPQDNVPLNHGCTTALGNEGFCKSFRECYPLIKVADYAQWEGWVMGHYDTCKYLNQYEEEVLGICCTEPVGTPPQQTPDVQRQSSVLPASPQALRIAQPSVGVPASLMYWSGPPAPTEFRQIPANWPPAIPPLPTHPPDHTAPTHPPSLVAGVTSTRPIAALPPATTTTWATLPPSAAVTTKPTTKQTWPPAFPTQPTIPDTQPVDGSCGAKNGFQYQTYDGKYDVLDEERIVGGHNADLNEWPWIVALFNNGRQFCGGSLIDDKHVLSAAHCVAHMTSWDVARLTARLGDYNIRTPSETQHLERKIKRVVRHRGFDMRTLYNDIAILTLDQPVTFSKNIRPVCLPGSGRAYSGQIATVIGWGSLREGGPQPSVLQEVSIPVWTNAECRQKYGGAAPGGIVEHMICAGKASMDSCSGDSGGPLMVNEGGRWTQVGVVSWGIGCGKGQYPGVYTRVTAFLPWIQKNAK